MARGGVSFGHAAALALIACTLAGSAHAQAPAQPAAAPAAPATADAKRGKSISYTCLGCHGIPSYRNAYPEYSVPKLEGQNPDYLTAALKGYRDGDRSHLTMHSQASTLSDQDIADIALYFAGPPLKPTGKTPADMPKAAALCTSCHGADGVAVAPIYPSLAGQHQDYLVRALDEYKHGGRKNPIMSGFAANLKDEDIVAIASYFASQTPPLRTEARPSTFLGEKH